MLSYNYQTQSGVDPVGAWGRTHTSSAKDSEKNGTLHMVVLSKLCCASCKLVHHEEPRVR